MDQPLQDSHAALLTGALDQLMRHQLSGCIRAAHQAARLLELLAERPELDGETRDLCGRMRDRLEADHG